MTRAYNELYLEDARLALGSMLEDAVYLFGIDLQSFWAFFLASHISDDFGHGLSGTVSGKSGWELAVEILEDAGIDFPHNKPTGVIERSREFWAGWALAQYQWWSGLAFREIEAFAPIHDIVLMYSPYHEMDITHFYEALESRRKAQCTSLPHGEVL